MVFLYARRLALFVLYSLIVVVSATGVAAAQGWQWASQSAGSGAERATAMATVTDTLGNVYACGSFNGTASFGGFSLSAQGGSDAYLVKFGTSGNVLWAVNAGGSGNDAAQALAVDSAGNIYLGGYYESDTAWFGTLYLVNSGIRKSFVARYDASGNPVWVQGATGSGRDEVRALTTDMAGSIYAVGRFSDSLIVFGPDTLVNTSTDSSDNMFLAKYNPLGSVFWLRQGLGNGIEPTSIAFAPPINVVVAGSFHGPATFGTTTLTSAGGADLFVTALNIGGTYLWSQSAGGSGDDFANAVSVDLAGNIWIGGGYTSATITLGDTVLTNSGNTDLFVARMNASGITQRAFSAGGSDSEQVNALVCQNNGSVFFAGNFKSSSITIGGGTLANAGIQNLFLSRCDSTTAVTLNRNIGGTLAESANGIARFPDGSVYVAGALTSPSVIFSFTTLTASVPGQAYVARFNDTAVVPGPIMAPVSICVGATATLSDPMSEGYWSVSNTAIATIDPYAGVLTGVASGTDTIFYTIHGYTVITTISVDSPANPGIITGPGALCMFSNITLTDTIGPGRWYTTGTYTSVDSFGVVTGLNAGTDTVKFIDSNVCGIATAMMPVTVNSSPVVSPISGATSVCQGSTATLIDVTAGGSWSASNTHATINILGVVTGASAGIDTIWYRKTNGVCTTMINQTITVIPHPVAGTISGVSSLCVGVTDTFTDSVTGGTWGSLTPSKLFVDTTGVATGVAGGIGIVGYTVYNTCGAATATHTVTVLPLSNPGTISGPGRVCAGATITLTDTTSGGSWSATNLYATDSAGIVTGAIAGTDTLLYTTTNICGSQSAIHIITVDPLPVVTPILGATGLCLGDSTLLADSTAGGSWSVSNGLLTVSGGMIVSHGLYVGIDTVSYTIANSCGSVSAVQVVHVDTIPAAGLITGPDSLCAGSSLVFADSVSGGVWTVTDPYLCFVTDSLITGIFGGEDTLVYTVTNGCASVMTRKSIYVIAIPVGGFIAGPDTVCVSGSIELFPSNPGGNWAVTNTAATDTGALIYGVAPGFDTVVYSLTNGCGSDTAYKAVYVKPQPTVAPLTGVLQMCIYSTVTLADTSYPGYWNVTNGNATVTDGIVNGTHAGTDTVIYTHTDLCGSASAQAVVTIDPLPDPGTIVGADTVCQGDSVHLTDAVTGGVWTSQLTFVATVTGGMVHALLPGTDSIFYSLTNACGTASAALGIAIVTPVVPIAGGGHLACVGGIRDTIWAYPAGGIWTSSGSGASLTPFAGGVEITGTVASADTIFYTLSGHCGTYRDTVAVTIGQMVQTVISGPSTLCVGKTDTLTAVPAGGFWSAGPAAISLVGITEGVVATGDTAGTGVVYYSLINQCGPGTDSAIITVYSKAYCDSVNEVRGPVAGSAGFALYPNPTTGELFIHTETGHATRQIVIRDMTGRIASCTIISSSENDMQIDIHEHTQGIYMVEISDGVTTERGPVVIARQ